MKFLFDFGPIILFFIVFKWGIPYTNIEGSLNLAIYTLTAATFVQMMYARLTTGKFVTSQVLTFALLVVFGGLSIWYNDARFLMWKLSILYVVFAIALIGSIWIGSKTLLERMMGKELQLPRAIWARLTWLWSVGFMGIALVNFYFYIIPYSSSYDSFAKSAMLDPDIKLDDIDCSQMPAENLCLEVQHVLNDFVNFKLFGTLGLTLLLIVITVVILSKNIKERESGV